MPHEYEVFSGSFERNPLWLESIQGFDAAYERMQTRANDLPGPYFLYSVVDGQVVATVNTTKAKTASASQ